MEKQTAKELVNDILNVQQDLEETYHDWTVRDFIEEMKEEAPIVLSALIIVSDMKMAIDKHWNGE